MFQKVKRAMLVLLVISIAIFPFLSETVPWWYMFSPFWFIFIGLLLIVGAYIFIFICAFVASFVDKGILGSLDLIKYNLGLWKKRFGGKDDSEEEINNYK